MGIFASPLFFDFLCFLVLFLFCTLCGTRGSLAGDPRCGFITVHGDESTSWVASERPASPTQNPETRKTEQLQEEKKTKKRKKRKFPRRNKHKKTTFFQNKVKCFFSVRQFDAKTKKTYITLHFVTYECREHYNTFKNIGKT